MRVSQCTRCHETVIWSWPLRRWLSAGNRRGYCRDGGDHTAIAADPTRRYRARPDP